MLLRRVARPLLSAAFIGQGLASLRNPDGAADAARPAMEGLQRLPASAVGNLPGSPKQFALTNAAIQIAAGVLLATGKTPRLASAALAATMIPGNLGAHMFWTEGDPDRKADERRAFLTDLSLLGGLIIASADTAGRPSLGWRGRRAAERLTDTVSSTLRGDDAHSWLHDSELGERLSHGLQLGVEHGRELASTASAKGVPVLEAALNRGTELAREKSAELAQTARRGRSRVARKRFTRRLRRFNPAQYIQGF